jgi:hypothetical protein
MTLFKPNPGAQRCRGAEDEALHPHLEAYLLEGETPPDDAGAEVRGIEHDHERAKRLWRRHRSRLLAEARGRGFNAYAVALFDDDEVPGLPSYRRHQPDPRAQPWRPCRHCRSRDLEPHACLS